MDVKTPELILIRPEMNNVWSMAIGHYNEMQDGYTKSKMVIQKLMFNQQSNI